MCICYVEFKNLLWSEGRWWWRSHLCLCWMIPKGFCLRLEEYVKVIFLFVDQPHCLLALLYISFCFFSSYFIIIVYVNYFSFSGAINLPVQYCSLVLCRISASFFFSYLFILHISKTLFKWSRKSHKIWDHNIYKYILWYISGKNKNIFHQFFDQKKIFHQFSLSPINR